MVNGAGEAKKTAAMAGSSNSRVDPRRLQKNLSRIGQSERTRLLYCELYARTGIGCFCRSFFPLNSGAKPAHSSRGGSGYDGRNAVLFKRSQSATLCARRFDPSCAYRHSFAGQPPYDCAHDKIRCAARQRSRRIGPVRSRFFSGYRRCTRQNASQRCG